MLASVCRAATACAVCFGYAAPKLSAQDGGAAGRVGSSVARLREETLDRCLLTFHQTREVERNGKPHSRTAGTVKLGRCGVSLMVDVETAGPPREGLDKGSGPVPQHRQHFMAEGRRCVEIAYEDARSGPRISAVMCDTRLKFGDDYDRVTRNASVGDLLAYLSHTDIDLATLSSRPPDGVAPSRAGGVVATYRTDFGVVEITTLVAVGREAVSSVRLTQSASDRYTRHANLRLAGVPKSVVGSHPAGLSRVVKEVVLTYPTAAGSGPLDSLTESEEYAAGEDVWRSVRRLRLVAHKRCESADEVDRLHLPIPDGEAVDMMDPSYQSLSLAWKKGEVVRQVDGAPLEIAVAEASRATPRYVYIAAFALLLIAAAGGWWALVGRRGR